MNKVKAALSAGIIAFMIAATSFLVAGNNTVKKIVLLTDKNSGKTTTVYKGTTIVLKIASQPDGGYIIDSVNYNKLILRLIKHINYSPGANSRLGQPGTAAWEFNAISFGKSVIKITAIRPWNKKDAITIYSSLIKVRDK